LTNLNNIDRNFNDFKQSVDNSNLEKCEEISIWIKKQIELDVVSSESHNQKEQHERKWHPVRPVRGEVFMAEMGCNVGVEFKDYHPVLILQNDTGNKFGDTTIVLPITELDGRYDKNIHSIIRNTNFESVERNGLDKDPSLIKLADITTIDKSRLKTKIGKVQPEFINNIGKKVKNILQLG